MAYSVDWVAKIITIPQGDLTFLSGNNYSLDTANAHEELRRLEWAFADGLWAPRIINFFETVTLSGIPKTPSVEVINGYTMDFTGSNYNVILSGYDNNFVDVYVPSNGISILGNNSVGRQTITTGSGLDAGQATELTQIHGQVTSIEGGFGLAQWIRLISAAVTNRMTGADTGTVHARNMANTKDRLVVPVSSDGRGQPTMRDPD